MHHLHAAWRAWRCIRRSSTLPSTQAGSVLHVLATTAGCGMLEHWGYATNARLLQCLVQSLSLRTFCTELDQRCMHCSTVSCVSLLCFFRRCLGSACPHRRICAWERREKLGAGVRQGPRTRPQRSATPPLLLCTPHKGHVVLRHPDKNVRTPTCPHSPHSSFRAEQHPFMFNSH